ncbi:MAG: riboflavin synthase [Spirochaetes bacterium]|nr:riboflavin synthase [Spirochaetota bacterium]
MFTGLIEEIGIVESIKAAEESDGEIYLTVSAKKILDDIKIGDSVSIDGACQTVTKLSRGSFTVFASKVTCEATTFGTFLSGRRVNLERAMAANARFGGHFVQGHVDGRGKIKSIVKDANGLKIEISVPKSISKYIASKGSIAVDGISLTVVSLTADGFILYIIPETIKNTTLFEKVSAVEVNIEVDILAKYVERITGNGEAGQRKDEKDLKRALMEEGFM